MGSFSHLKPSSNSEGRESCNLLQKKYHTAVHIQLLYVLDHAFDKIQLNRLPKKNSNRNCEWICSKERERRNCWWFLNKIFGSKFLIKMHKLTEIIEQYFLLRKSNDSNVSVKMYLPKPDGFVQYII